MKKMKTVIVILAAVLLLTGCADRPEPAVTEATAAAQTEPTPAPETESAPTLQPEVPDLSFAELGSRFFTFSSGSGGWRTELRIRPDGSFEGEYHDSDMGDSGPDYPNGTVYTCTFSGHFSPPAQIDDHTWAFTMDSITYEHSLGEEIQNGIRYFYTEPYGLDQAENLYLYRPGSALADLPQAFLDWIGYHNWQERGKTELNFYGLYNENAQTGFRSWCPYETVMDQIDLAEETAAALEEKARTDDTMTQADLNWNAEVRYNVWDNVLNTQWRLLLDNLDKETMDALTREQLAWIQEKESAAEAAADEVGGGSLSPIFYYGKAAELTRDRVYVLADYLK